MTKRNGAWHSAKRATVVVGERDQAQAHAWEWRQRAETAERTIAASAERWAELEKLRTATTRLTSQRDEAVAHMQALESRVREHERLRTLLSAELAALKEANTRAAIADIGTSMSATSATAELRARLLEVEQRAEQRTRAVVHAQAETDRWKRRACFWEDRAASWKASAREWRTKTRHTPEVRMQAAQTETTTSPIPAHKRPARGDDVMVRGNTRGVWTRARVSRIDADDKGFWATKGPSALIRWEQIQYWRPIDDDSDTNARIASMQALDAAMDGIGQAARIDDVTEPAHPPAPPPPALAAHVAAAIEIAAIENAVQRMTDVIRDVDVAKTVDVITRDVIERAEDALAMHGEVTVRIPSPATREVIAMIEGAIPGIALDPPVVVGMREHLEPEDGARAPLARRKPVDIDAAGKAAGLVPPTTTPRLDAALAHTADKAKLLEAMRENSRLRGIIENREADLARATRTIAALERRLAGLAGEPSPFRAHDVAKTGHG